MWWPTHGQIQIRDAEQTRLHHQTLGYPVQSYQATGRTIHQFIAVWCHGHYSLVNWSLLAPVQLQLRIWKYLVLPLRMQKTWQTQLKPLGYWLCLSWLLFFHRTAVGYLFSKSRLLLTVLQTPSYPYCIEIYCKVSVKNW